MGGFGTDSSSQRQSSQLATLSPIAGGLANLFGMPISGVPGGGMTVNPTSPFILPSVFGPSNFQDLSSLAQPLNPVQFDFGQIQQGAQNAFGTLSEASQNGLIQPAQDLFRMQFDETVNGLMNRFGQAGLNANDTDFQTALLHEAQMGSTQLADLAQNRRLAASQLLPEVGASMFDLEGGARAAERARSSGGQQLDLLLTLAGVNSQGSTTNQGRGSSSGFNKGGIS